MRQNLPALRQTLATVVESMGYELVGVEYHPNPTNALLRIYIDCENGVNLDDCQRVSHQVGGVLDVEDPIAERYTLEVSSPGLDRPLFEAEHFIRFAGSDARLELDALLEGRRKLSGRLRGMDGDVVLLVDGGGREWRVPLARIAKARLAPEL